jgi:hypothetical protein
VTPLHIQLINHESSRRLFHIKSNPTFQWENHWTHPYHATQRLHQTQKNKRTVRAGLHYGPWHRTMEDGLCQWSKFMVRLNGPTLEKNSFKSLGPLTRCKLNVDQKEWPCSKKWRCWFFWYMPKKGNFGENSSLTILLSFLGLYLCRTDFWAIVWLEAFWAKFLDEWMEILDYSQMKELL